MLFPLGFLGIFLLNNFLKETYSSRKLELEESIENLLDKNVDVGDYVGIRFLGIGATIFSLLLSLSSWAFIQSYTEKVVIEDAKYIPIVYDNGFDLIIAKADDNFPEESIEPTLEQLSENLRKGSRSGANVKIKIRKLEKISDGVSKPVVIGEVQKNVKMN